MTGGGLGGAGPCVNTEATDGSGGLYSTANDMARWLRHNLHDADGALSLSHAVYRQRQALEAAIGFDEAGPMAGLGLGWVFVAADGARPALLAKSGGGVGFMSYIAFVPGRDVGVFVAVSRADFGMFGPLTQAANGIISSLVTR
jgi:D-alanyl-D-alanine-carboxypeptidase/D-alanyl-D-alanine-endopeptidase